MIDFKEKRFDYKSIGKEDEEMLELRSADILKDLENEKTNFFYAFVFTKPSSLFRYAHRGNGNFQHFGVFYFFVHCTTLLFYPDRFFVALYANICPKKIKKNGIGRLFSPVRSLNYIISRKFGKNRLFSCFSALACFLLFLSFPAAENHQHIP